MGKKTRKTRWRALTLADEFSDSETSSTTTAPEVFKTNKFSNRYTYSSHSTPRRKYQYDGTKSTRSSSTTDENKMPFNENDYTKISTPRQDVLFKKGYLNKPKSYNTQSSTGASTNSTGNSTGNGTPEYQSTDLEYESQFVFPNGFVDQNGFYYVNSYDYPFMFYNVPTYYPEYSNYRSKKYSSGSLAESTSPNNEETTSQDLSCGEASNSHSDNTEHHHSPIHVNSHNGLCSKYYENGTSSPHDSANEECHDDQTRKVKKRRRRKTTCQSEEQDTNSDEEKSNDEEKSTLPQRRDSENIEPKKEAQPLEQSNESPYTNSKEIKEKIEPEKKIQTLGQQNESFNAISLDSKETVCENPKEQSSEDNQCPERKNPDLLNESTTNLNDSENVQNYSEHYGIANSQDTLEQKQINNESGQTENSQNLNQLASSQETLTANEITSKNRDDLKGSDFSGIEILNKVENTYDEELSNSSTKISGSDTDQNHDLKVPKYNLKVDAEEFVPRAYRVHDIPLNPVQFVNISGNFVPLPLFPFSGQNFNTTFVPPGFPINLIPPDPKLFPTFVGFPHNGPPPNEHGEVCNEHHYNPKTQLPENSCDISNTANDQKLEIEPKDKNKLASKTIDIATVVSKLEIAAKEQKNKENSCMNEPEDSNSTCPNKHPKNHKFRSNYKIRAQNSPQKEIKYQNRELKHKHHISISKSDSNSMQHVGGNPTNSPLMGRDCYIINHPESSSKRNTDSSVCSNSSTHASSQTTPTVISNHSPLRENDSYRKLRYNKHLPESVTNAIPTQSSDFKSPSFSKKSPEKYKKVWKQSYNNNYNKWKQNNTDDIRTRSFDKKITEDGLKERNISGDTKTIVECSLQGNIDVDKDISSKPLLNRSVNLPQESSSTSLRSPNQWIAVQKRKKRKNKNIEDVDSLIDDEIDDNQNDQFESYDVNLLVDVVIPSENIRTNLETNDTNVEIDQNKSNILDPQNEETLTVVVEEEVVSSHDLDKPKEGERNSVLSENIIKTQTSHNEMQSVSELLNELLPESEDMEGIETQGIKDKKKKSKKNSQKVSKKKVIIKDIDLSCQNMEIKEPVKKIVTKVEKSSEVIANTSEESLDKDKCDETKTEVAMESYETFEKEVSPESANSSEQDEKKKSKKKKKKSSKSNTTISSNSDIMLGSIDDSFDFLDLALKGEAEDKTNDEISQELDKIIQKGMLSSIEEKIKSLNINENDGFFKSVSTKLSRKETSMGYTKIPDFTEILKPTSKPQLVSEEIDIQNMTCSNLFHDADPIEPTIEDGLFLENNDVMGIVEDDQKAVLPDESEDIKNEKLQINKYDIEIGEFKQPNTLYPITKAVKEWMVRTRENTPDVELLKSPSRIFEEFGDNSNSDSETDACETVENFCKELSPNSEITLFTTEREQTLEQDLLDYWDDDVKSNKYVDVSDGYKSDNSVTEDDEEELPVYDSKYGKNEDFLDIQKKVRERNEICARTPQTQTGLPQKAAVCCNIM